MHCLELRGTPRKLHTKHDTLRPMCTHQHPRPTPRLVRRSCRHVQRDEMFLAWVARSETWVGGEGEEGCFALDRL